MINDEMAEAEGGRGISEDRLFVRIADVKISQEHGAPDLQTEGFKGVHKLVGAKRKSRLAGLMQRPALAGRTFIRT